MSRNENKFRKYNAKHNTLLHKVFVSNVVSTESSKSAVSADVLSTLNRSSTSQPCFVRDNNIGDYLVNEKVSARTTLLATALVNV